MIQKAEENSPKIIISSYNLLNLDGLEASIRANTANWMTDLETVLDQVRNDLMKK